MKITYIGAAHCPACPGVFKQLLARNVKFDAVLDLAKDEDCRTAATLKARPSLPQVIVETDAGRISLGPDVRSICAGLRQCGVSV